MPEQMSEKVFIPNFMRELFAAIENARVAPKAYKKAVQIPTIDWASIVASANAARASYDREQAQLRQGAGPGKPICPKCGAECYLESSTAVTVVTVECSNGHKIECGELAEFAQFFPSQESWVSVKERLPELDAYVLGWFDKADGELDSKVETCWFSNRGWRDSYAALPIPPTHWRSLPAPPETQGETK